MFLFGLNSVRFGPDIIIWHYDMWSAIGHRELWDVNIRSFGDIALTIFS